MPYIPTDTMPFSIEQTYASRHIPPKGTTGTGWFGLWRIYFNSRAEAPLVWSIDRGTSASEVKIREIHLVQCSGISHFTPKADNLREPRAWIEGYGRVEIFDAVATIFPAGDK